MWDEREQHLFLVRDHTGERPLFYTSTANNFAFASMPKGLHRLPFVAAEVDEDYVARYLTLANIPIEQTIFRNMRRLPSGCALSVQRGKRSSGVTGARTNCRIFDCARRRSTWIAFAKNSTRGYAAACAQRGHWRATERRFG